MKQNPSHTAPVDASPDDVDGAAVDSLMPPEVVVSLEVCAPVLIDPDSVPDAEPLVFESPTVGPQPTNATNTALRIQPTERWDRGRAHVVKA